MSECEIEVDSVSVVNETTEEAIVLWYRWTLEDYIGYSRDCRPWDRKERLSLTMTLIFLTLTMIMHEDGRGFGVTVTLLSSLPLLVYAYKIQIAPRRQFRQSKKIATADQDVALLFSASEIQVKTENASMKLDWNYYETVFETAGFIHLSRLNNSDGLSIPKRAFETPQHLENLRSLVAAKMSR